MSEEQQAISKDKYVRTSTDNWIDIGAILVLVCSLIFLILSLATLLPVFLWLMGGAWVVAGVLWWWRTFRRMWWVMQRSRDEEQKDTTATRTRRFLLGVGLIIGGVLASAGLNRLPFWGVLLLWPLPTILTASGAVLIVQVVKSKFKRNT